MKHISLLISLILTGLVFSMSFLSGNDSASLSSGVTDVVYRILNNLIPNNQIEINNLHLFIRKSAHISEYMILGASWFFTIKCWKKSLATLLVIGFVISSLDEAIQIFAIERGASIIDVIIFDYLPYCMISVLLTVFHNRKRELNMSATTLLKLQDNSITPEIAYKELYKNEKKVRIPLFRRAHFIKLRIIIPEEKGVNRFLGVLFFLPLPILFVRIILSFVKINKYMDDNDPISKKDIMRLISYKGTQVNVNTHSGEKIIIKTI